MSRANAVHSTPCLCVDLETPGYSLSVSLDAQDPKAIRFSRYTGIDNAHPKQSAKPSQQAIKPSLLPACCRLCAVRCPIRP